MFYWYSRLKAVQFEGVHELPDIDPHMRLINGNCVLDIETHAVKASLQPWFSSDSSANTTASRALLTTMESIRLHRYSLDQKIPSEDCSWRTKSSLTDVFLFLVNPLLAQLLAKPCRQRLLCHHISFSHVTEPSYALLELVQEVFWKQSNGPSSLSFILVQSPSVQIQCVGIFSFIQSQKGAMRHKYALMMVHTTISQYSWSERGAKTRKMQQALLCTYSQLAGGVWEKCSAHPWITEGIELNLGTCRGEDSLNSWSCLPLQNQKETGFKPWIEVSFLSLMIRLNLKVIVFLNYCHITSHQAESVSHLVNKFHCMKFKSLVLQ